MKKSVIFLIIASFLLISCTQSEPLAEKGSLADSVKEELVVEEPVEIVVEPEVVLPPVEHDKENPENAEVGFDVLGIKGLATKYKDIFLVNRVHLTVEGQFRYLGRDSFVGSDFDTVTIRAYNAHGDSTMTYDSELDCNSAAKVIYSRGKTFGAVFEEGNENAVFCFSPEMDVRETHDMTIELLNNGRVKAAEHVQMPSTFRGVELTFK
jgi:hypothetical protein